MGRLSGPFIIDNAIHVPGQGSRAKKSTRKLVRVPNKDCAHDVRGD